MAFLRSLTNNILSKVLFPQEGNKRAPPVISRRFHERYEYISSNNWCNKKYMYWLRMILFIDIILFIYSRFHDNIYIQVYTCANGLDAGIAYICPLQLVRQFKYIYTHIVMQIQKLQVV